MPEPVYDNFLTSASARRLAQLVRDVPHPVAIAGGHAVRLRVEDGWRRAFGEAYFGSRDIDLCYLVDPNWTLDELRKSAVGQAPARIRDVGYKPLGSFRFGVAIDTNGNVLDKEPGLPAVRELDYDTLYLDVMVTHMHKNIVEVLGFTPVDEPILRVAFDSKGARDIIPSLGENVYLPSASVLIACKLKSLPERTKDDKAVKDICDLYALAAYGGEFMSVIRNVTHSLLDDVPGLVRVATKHEFFPRAAEHLGLSKRDLEAAIQPIALRPVEPDGEEAARDERRRRRSKERAEVDDQ